jgi:hypothetical protein
MPSFSDFFLHASDEEKIKVFTEAARRANQEQRRYMNEKIFCTKCNQEIIDHDWGHMQVIMDNKNKMIKKYQCKQCYDTPPVNGELSACCKAFKEVFCSDDGTVSYICSNCGAGFLTPKQWQAIRPTNNKADVIGYNVSGTESVRIDKDSLNEWYDSYGMEIVNGADPRGVIQRLLVEHERRMKGE